MRHVVLPNLGSVPVLGIGCMGMSEFYGPPQPPQESLDLLTAAYDGGIRLFDTADFYGDGENERLLGRFLAKVKPEAALIASKCGIRRGTEILSDGNFRREFDGRPEWIRACCEASLRRLGIETIDLYYLHRVDPTVPIEESAGAMSDLIDQGLIRAWGVSEADAQTIARAHHTCPVAALQSEYSLWTRDVEKEILSACATLGIAFVAYAPLGRGIFPAYPNQPQLPFANGDFRLSLQRAQPENMQRNKKLYHLIEMNAKTLDITPFQLMLAWVLGSNPNVVAIPGMRRMSSLHDNLTIANLSLPSEIRKGLDYAFRTNEVAGGRYTVGI